MKDLLIILAVFASGLVIGLILIWGYFKKLVKEQSEELNYKRDEIDRLNDSLFKQGEELNRHVNKFQGAITRDEYGKMQVSYKENAKKKEKWIEEKKKQIKTLHRQLKESDEERHALTATCEEQKVELTELREKTEQQETELVALKNELFDGEEPEVYGFQESLSKKEQEIGELRGEIEELEELIADDQRMLDYGQKNLMNFQHIERELYELQTAVPNQAPPVKEKEVKKSNDLSEKAASDPNFPKEKLDIDVVHADYATEIDDLTQLKGIGAYTALKLNAIGIQNFKQISHLSSEDIKLVNTAIKFFPGRILRDKWIEQAEDLIAAQSS